MDGFHKQALREESQTQKSRRGVIPLYEVQRPTRPIRAVRSQGGGHRKRLWEALFLALGAGDTDTFNLWQFF